MYEVPSDYKIKFEKVKEKLFPCNQIHSTLTSVRFIHLVKRFQNSRANRPVRLIDG